VNRGDLYLVRTRGTRDPKRQRVFVIVSRQALIESKFSSVICAPIYSRHDGISTQVAVDIREGLKHESSIHCDELVSIPKALLTNYVGRLAESKLPELNIALARALGLA
jgi:mRNA interferase MazF